MKVLQQMLCAALILSSMTGYSHAMEEGENQSFRMARSPQLIQHPLPEVMWVDLPAEMWMNIFGRLPLKDVCRAFFVCSRLKVLAEDESLLATFATPEQKEEAKKQELNPNLALKRMILEEAKNPLYFTIKNELGQLFHSCVTYTWGYDRIGFLDVDINPHNFIHLRKSQFPIDHVETAQGIAAIIAIGAKGDLWGMRIDPQVNLQGTLIIKSMEKSRLGHNFSHEVFNPPPQQTSGG